MGSNTGAPEGTQTTTSKDQVSRLDQFISKSSSDLPPPSASDPRRCRRLQATVGMELLDIAEKAEGQVAHPATAPAARNPAAEVARDAMVLLEECLAALFSLFGVPHTAISTSMLATGSLWSNINLAGGFTPFIVAAGLSVVVLRCVNVPHYFENLFFSSSVPRELLTCKQAPHWLQPLASTIHLFTALVRAVLPFSKLFNSSTRTPGDFRLPISSHSTLRS